MNHVATTELSSDAEQFLTFVLGGEEYGVTILQVQGIQGWDRATPIPNTPEYILGVINLRGAIVPIVDLRNLTQAKRALRCRRYLHDLDESRHVVMGAATHENTASDPGVPRDQRASEATLPFIEHELEATEVAERVRLAVRGCERAEGDRLAHRQNPVRLRFVAPVDTLVVRGPGKCFARQLADDRNFIVFDDAPGTIGKL